MRYPILAVAAMLCASVAAHADTITQNFSTGPFSYTAGLPTQSTQLSIQGFNPSLGTLTSISTFLSGTYTVQTTDISSFQINVSTRRNSGNQVTGSASADNRGNGTYSITAMGQNFTGATLFDFFTSTGEVHPFFNYYDGFAASVRNATPNGLSGTVTYNYTAPLPPVAVTPEPSSLALLGTGLLGVAGVVRRRLLA